MAEFTGERVVPGEVDVDLWNEHLARYHFASRLARSKRVLDAGCGAGYGSALLAQDAFEVFGVDLKPEAVAYARGHYSEPNLSFAQGSCAALPIASASLDLIVAFEVIEHITEWREFLAEARRVLRPSGQFVVSTPNKDYYTASRGPSGLNPFHVHEFTYEEFLQELRQVFPSVCLYLENHSESIVFQPVSPDGAALVKLEEGSAEAHEASFYVAVCAASTQTGAPTYVYVPRASNVLFERERHITRLEGELVLKDEWLATIKSEHADLVEKFRALQAELEESNRWAGELNKQLKEAADKVSAYEAKIAELEAERVRSVEWVRKTEANLEERTKWALSLEQEKSALEQQLSLVRASRWVKFGKSLGLGPKLGDA
ncbi:MAG: methyltransferase domain-containing protein [Acidobacteriales bacterium]|nr:methyltransferase domain-containing protein [Terriglobales bacterium]